MRPFVIGICLLAAACGGGGVPSPAAPSSAGLVAPPGLAPTASPTIEAVEAQSASASELPFSGSFDLQTTGTFNCPPTCPPTTLVVRGTVSGTATHLGRFTGSYEDVVDLATVSSTGLFAFTAANGDQLFTTTVGREDRFTPPNISHVTVTATIAGGTGRFAGATGSLTIEHTSAIDFQAATSTGSGTVQGRISLAREPRGSGARSRVAGRHEGTAPWARTRRGRLAIEATTPIVNRRSSIVNVRVSRCTRCLPPTACCSGPGRAPSPRA